MVLFASKNGNFCHEKGDASYVANISYKGFCSQLFKTDFFFFLVFKKSSKGHWK